MTTGDRIPEILGTDQFGNQLKAKDFEGKKIVLYAYPKANTPGCTAEACSLQEHLDELKAKGYTVIGVSKDKQETQQSFAQKYNLDFPLIADTQTSLLQEIGAWGEKTNYGKTSVGTIRSTFLVDENGVVEKVFRDRQIKTKVHAEQILDYLNKQ